MVTRRHVAVDRLGDGAVDRAIQEPHLGTRGPGRPLPIPDQEDAVAQDGQLDHHLGQVEAFHQPLDGVAAGGGGAQAGTGVVEPRLSGVGDGVQELGDVIDQARDRQALDGRPVADRFMPTLDDRLFVGSEELGQLGSRDVVAGGVGYACHAVEIARSAPTIPSGWWAVWGSNPRHPA